MTVIAQAIAAVEAAGRVESALAESLRATATQHSGAAAARRLELAEGAERGAEAAARISTRLRQLASRSAELVSEAALKQALDTDLAALKSRSSYRARRLADIQKRLAELRQARATEPDDGRAPPPPKPDPLQRAQQAHLHWQQSADNLLQAQQLSAEAFRRAATAHDRVAAAYSRSARAGIGDAAENNRMADFHQAAATADRQQALNVTA